MSEHRALEVRQVGENDWISLEEFLRGGNGPNEWVKIREISPFVQGYYRVKSNGSEGDPAVWFLNEVGLTAYAADEGLSAKDFVRVTVTEVE